MNRHPFYNYRWDWQAFSNGEVLRFLIPIMCECVRRRCR